MKNIIIKKNTIIFILLIATNHLIGQSEDFNLPSMHAKDIPNYYISVPQPSPVGGYTSGNTRSTSSSGQNSTQNSNQSSSQSSATPAFNANTMIQTMLVQSLVNAVFSAPAAPAAPSQAQLEAQRIEMERIQQEQARQQKIRDSLNLRAYNKLMDNSISIKEGDGNLDFMKLDGEMEQMRADAEGQFSGEGVKSENVSISKGTDFFGQGLSEPELNTLLDINNDPNIVDLSETKTYIVDNIKNESEIVKQENNIKEENTKPKLSAEECTMLNNKLNSYTDNRQKFLQNIDKTILEVNNWEEKNNQAYWNAVTDGISSVAGIFLDYVIESRKSALKIKEILEKNEIKYIADGAFTKESIEKYKKMLDLRINNYNNANVGKKMSDISEYYGFVKNIIQTTTEQLSGSDSEYKYLINTLKEKGYLSDFPVVEASQFLAGKTIDSFIKQPIIQKGFLKVSYVTIAQMAVDQAYNALDWYLSYKNMCKLKEINGKELEAAKYIQNKIFEVKAQLNNCN